MTFMNRLLAAALAAFFIIPAFAQNPGTVPLYSVPLGLGAGKQGFGSVALGNGQLLIGQTSAAPAAATPSGDVTINPSGVTAIGANKVTNSQIATMGANTTKCNATGGTANPTDCNASTMKTNLGLVIGTNVEAWDNDLDCIAALATTGQIKRTGTGTCSAGAVALSDLATGSQDTVIGYFGSTTTSAIAMNNCTGALTYSTATHTFGCNTTSGTGTVTSVTCFGSAITTSGTCATAATKSDQQTGSSSTAVVTPSQAQSHDSATKVWVSFTGQSSAGAVPIDASYNVTSVTKTANAGVYTVAFTTAFASANYSCEVTSEGTSTVAPLAGILSSTAKTASQITLFFENAGATTGQEPVHGHLVCFGRQ